MVSFLPALIDHVFVYPILVLFGLLLSHLAALDLLFHGSVIGLLLLLNLDAL